MSGIGYKKSQPSLKSNKPVFPKEKVKQTQYSNCKNKQKSQNHAFRYSFNNNKNYKNKYSQSHFQNTFGSQKSNKTYFKGPDGWFYELKNKNVPQNRIQNNDSFRVVSRHYNKFNSCKNDNPTYRTQNRSSNNYRRQAQGFKGHNHNIYNNGTKSNIIFCNYCCKLGHTSLECRFRNGGNKLNVTWVLKTREN